MSAVALTTHLKRVAESETVTISCEATYNGSFSPYFQCQQHYSSGLRITLPSNSSNKAGKVVYRSAVRVLSNMSDSYFQCDIHFNRSTSNMVKSTIANRQFKSQTLRVFCKSFIACKKIPSRTFFLVSGIFDTASILRYCRFRF
jgi:hypothetical protein